MRKEPKILHKIHLIYNAHLDTFGEVPKVFYVTYKEWEQIERYFDLLLARINIDFEAEFENTLYPIKSFKNHNDLVFKGVPIMWIGGL